MADRILPRYPIYIPSKGRADKCMTARFLINDGMPFYLVVELQEHDIYAALFGEDRLLILPSNDQGLIFARNWIKEHAKNEGHERHWQIDDNIRQIYRMYRGKRIRCNSGIALAASEDFTDRYANIAITGLNYHMFIGLQLHREPPFLLNCRVYSCSLILNSLPHKWRSRYNDDVDICLQVLADGWCTILINAFLVDKQQTMKIKGGNTDALYQGDGRLKMARSMERLWPGVVETKRRFNRPQHVVKDAWRRFDTPLKLKASIDLDKIEPNEYGLKLKQVKPEIKSAELRQLVEDNKKLNER